MGRVPIQQDALFLAMKALLYGTGLAFAGVGVITYGVVKFVDVDSLIKLRQDMEGLLKDKKEDTPK